MTNEEIKQLQYYQGWMQGQIDHMEASADEIGKKKAQDVKKAWEAMDKSVDNLIRERNDLWQKLVRIQAILNEAE